MNKAYKGDGTYTEYGLRIGEWGTHDSEQWFETGALDGIDLSELTGSEKQIAWAMDIITKRYNNIKSSHAYGLNIFAAKAYEVEVNTAIKTGKLTSARQVIDNRHKFSEELDTLQAYGVTYEASGYTYDVATGTWSK